jgi:hypothetical protein
MKKMSIIFVTAISLMLLGCGATPQSTIAVDESFTNNKTQRIGVYVQSEEATTHIYGASCLLCYGVASAANSSLSSYLESIATDDIHAFGSVISEQMQAQGKHVEIVTLPTEIKRLPKFKGELGYPKRDFRALKEQLNLDTLIVIDIAEHGAHRSYNAYIPTSDPIGSVSGNVYTVDLNTNKYLQYERIDFKVMVSGEWDEPPTFPGVTDSYYEAVEKAKERIQLLFSRS